MALVDILMPQLGSSVVEGTVIEWHAAVGGAVVAEATVCEISTDKIDSECPAPASGTLAEILVEPGETVEVGVVLGRIATDGEEGAEGGKEPAAVGKALPPADTAGGGTESVANDAIRSSPISRRIAAEHGVDLATVAGTGRGGRVTKKDVLAYIEAGVEPPLHSDSPYRPDPDLGTATAAALAATAVPATGPGLPDLGGVAAPLSRMRQRIGEAMHGSQQGTATCHTTVECDMTAIEEKRSELELTALPFVCRAVIETLAEFPDLNATLAEGMLTRFERVHLGIAVSLGDDGLIVPVIHDAQNLSPEGLGRRIRDLARRARDKHLSPDDVQGATFTITNPGAFGALWATPVIDVPQTGILDLEAIVRRPIVVTDDSGNESIAIRSMVNLILGWDHRAMDGVYAARFLRALRQRLESG